MSEPAVERSAQAWIERLGLTPVPVGGWFAVAMGTDERVAGPALPARFGGTRALYSSNWYLLDAGQVLRLHLLHQDELWFFHTGGPIRLHVFSESNGYSATTLGSDPSAGEAWHGVAPHSTWFGAELLEATYALVTCSLSPGYDPADSFVPTTGDLHRLTTTFPEHTDLLARLSGGAT